MPRDRRAPVVSNDDRLLLAERGYEPDDVADRMQDRVVVRVRGRFRLTEAAHVWRNSAEARSGDGRQLVPPRIPELGPAVTHQHERTCTLLRNVHADCVDRER